VGYRLAKNYLKMKMFVHSIDVCKKVIKDHPDFPKIRQKILNKARISIKP
jgi:tetratricopeptide repeat protein 21B